MEHRLRLAGGPPVRCARRRLDCRARGDQPSATYDVRGPEGHVVVDRAVGGLVAGRKPAITTGGAPSGQYWADGLLACSVMEEGVGPAGLVARLAGFGPAQ